MNAIERIKMVKAMEFICRNMNDEAILMEWLSIGVEDGDIEYGDLDVKGDDPEELEYYIDEVTFADLMDSFLHLMQRAYKSGGLYCDNVVSKPETEAEE